MVSYGYNKTHRSIGRLLTSKFFNCHCWIDKIRPGNYWLVKPNTAVSECGRWRNCVVDRLYYETGWDVPGHKSLCFGRLIFAGGLLLKDWLGLAVGMSEWW